MTQNDQSIIRVVICGEVRSGKSAMLNALLRENIIHDNLGKGERPSVFAEYGEAAAVHYFDDRGQICDPPGTPKGASIEGIQVSHEKTDLAAFEFVEVPLTSAEKLTESQISIIGSASIMIWVTIASQAWRLTEKQIVNDLGTARPRRSILAISRADKLRRTVDQEKILARMERETAEYFDARVLVTNSKRQIDATAKNASVWAESGAATILESLNEIAEDIYCEKDALRATCDSTEEPDCEVQAEVADDSIHLQEQASRDKISTSFSPDIDPLIKNLGRAMHMGMYMLKPLTDLTILNGDQATCRKVGATCKDIRSRWLSAYGASLTGDEEFGIVLRTPGQSVLYSDVSEDIALFSISHNSEIGSGLAQTRFSQVRNAILRAQ